MKDWKTTAAGIVGALCILAGMIWPEKINAETQQVIETATNEIFAGVGLIITLINGWKAKDPT